MVNCPVCGKNVEEASINQHLDSGCESHVVADEVAAAVKSSTGNVPSFFQTQAAKRASLSTSKPPEPRPAATLNPNGVDQAIHPQKGINKRTLDQQETINTGAQQSDHTPTKKAKLRDVAPLAERMRPRTLDEVFGQELVGPDGVIRGLIEENRVPSMILWGGPGTGKTTIARLIAHTAGCRFVEINSTSSGVQECKRLFTEAKNELSLSGRKTIIFCDEIHRFNKAQQDVFLGPVESGQVTLIGATTENPSFKVVNPLLSRCRTFTLAKLTDETIVRIMERAVMSE